MSLRIAFDMDGTLADFEAAYRAIEERIFGTTDRRRPVPGPEGEAVTQAAQEIRESVEKGRRHTSERDPAHRVVRSQRRQSRVWREIESTPDFWTTLEPIDPTALPRLQELTIRHLWEIFFVTQRPSTAGETVQRQTQRWLIRHGFDMPSVMVLRRSRGKLAESLHLDVLVDDSAKNCVDVLSESHTRPLLVLQHEQEDFARPSKARSLGIGVAPSIGAVLDILEEMNSVKTSPGLLERMARMVGWKGN